MQAVRGRLPQYVRVPVREVGQRPPRCLVDLLFRPCAAEAKSPFLDKKEATDRVLVVLEKLQEVESSKNYHLRQIFTTIHAKAVSTKLSTIHSLFGCRDVETHHPWLSSVSRECLIQRKNVHSESLFNEANQPDDKRHRSLNRILYRSRQRGFLELDLVLGRWTEENLENLDDEKLKSLVDVLDVENPELWKWLTGQEEAPEHLTKNPVFMEIHGKVMGALKEHAPAETRAKLGQPWVRGWDDNRKIGGPQVGNQ